MVKRKLFWTWVFCLPTLIVLSLVAVLPLTRTFYLSLTNANISNLSQPDFVWFKNYLRLLYDVDWWRSVFNTLIFTVSSVSIETVLGLGIALLLNHQFSGRGFVRASVFVPWAIPTVVSARIWALMFNDIFGVFNHLLLKLGFVKDPIAWLAEEKLSLFVLVMVDVWKATPFMALLLLAGLQNIPSNVYEAAKIDGAGARKRFFKITLPLMKHSLLITVLFRVLDALRVFDLPYVLSTNTKSTALISVFAQNQNVYFQEIGYGSAVSICIFFMIAMIAFFVIRGGQRNFGVEP